MPAPTLKLHKQRRPSTSLKPCNIYLDTHEKLMALSQASGLSLVKLIAAMVDFSLPYIEIVEGRFYHIKNLQGTKTQAVRMGSI